MQELNLLSLLSKSKVHHFVSVINNHSQNLVVAISLKGHDAHFFGKDLKLEISRWQFNNAQKLHLALLDLNKNCRLKKLQLNFALALKTSNQLILACQGGSVLLKRQNLLKEVLKSQAEIGMLIGKYSIDDELLLIAGNQELGQIICEKNRNKTLVVIFEQSLNDYFARDSNNALAFYHYQKKEKISWQEKINKLKKLPKQFIKIINKLFSVWQIIKSLRKEQKKHYQKLFITGAIILFFLTGSLFIWKEQQKKKLKQLGGEINGLVINTEELKLLSENQPVLARNKIKQSQENLEKLLVENNSLIAKKLIQTEISNLENELEKLASQNNLNSLTIFSNWHANYPDFLGTKIITTPKGVVVGNDQKNQLLLIKEENSFEIKDIEYQDFAIDKSDKEQLKIFIKDQGIKYLNWQDQEITELKAEGDSDRDGQLLESYQNYLYLVNLEKRNIYRYTLKTKELSEAIGWLVDKEGISFNNISDMSVNGDLWLSFKDGKIIKLSRGYQTEFSITGLDQLPKTNLIITSRENIDKLVILDKNNKRLIVSTKEGQLINEIKNNELAGVSDIDLASDGLSCFALSGSVIYQIKL